MKTLKIIPLAILLASQSSASNLASKESFYTMFSRMDGTNIILPIVAIIIVVAFIVVGRTIIDLINLMKEKSLEDKKNITPFVK